jgi:hypothetical protein
MSTRYNKALTDKYIIPSYKNKISTDFINEVVKDEHAYTQPKKGGKSARTKFFDIAEPVVPLALTALDPVYGPVVAPLSEMALKKLRKMLGGKITSKKVLSATLDALPYALSLVPTALAPEAAPILAPATLAVAKKARSKLKEKTGYGYDNPFVERFVNQVGYFPDDLVRPQTKEIIKKGGKKKDVKLASDLIDMTIGSIKNKRGGALPSFEELKKNLKPVAKMILKQSAQHLIPFLSEKVGEHFGNKEFGKAVGQAISDFLVDKLEGLGRSGGKNKKVKRKTKSKTGGCNGEPCDCEIDIEYKGGRLLQKPIRLSRDRPARPMTERKRRRNELIKKLVGNGMKFLDASKEATKIMREENK